MQYDETKGDMSFLWQSEQLDSGAVVFNGVIVTSADSWRRVHAEEALASKMLDAIREAKKFPGVWVHRPVPARRITGAKVAPRTDLQNLMDSVTELAGKLSVASPDDSLKLAADYAELRNRLTMMQREFDAAENMLEMARMWLSDETRRPDYDSSASDLFVA